jgi:deoxyribodipyrimidine photo-lyase
MVDPGRIPDLRLSLQCDAPPKTDGAYVMYWMTAARRVPWNFALQRAVGWARQLRRPLLVVEPLVCGGRWPSDRLHRFALQGMADNARRLADTPASYYPYVERRPGQARELFRAIGKQACLVVTDDYPIPLPSLETVTDASTVRVETIDGNGLLPLRAAPRAFPTAYALRRFLQRTLPDHLLDAPLANPLSRADIPRLERLPPSLVRRWPAANERMLAGDLGELRKLPIDHHVAPVATAGGTTAARRRWQAFLRNQLALYPDQRNQPEADATSGLAPYLHFGHISPHEVFHTLARHKDWSPDRLSQQVTGQREGWWGMSAAAEAFLDQVITWRELGLNCCFHRPDYDRYESLPPWARATLAKHARDLRAHVYTLEEFAAAGTHDRLWNAAQGQLLAEGRMHNYLRMLWGKKILEWSATPEEALETMIELNNRYALDGQDPNSYSGIFWTLGRYDRPWAPERPIFGVVRYMSAENTARKLRVKRYVDRYAPAAG